jgi:hypothetical protein
MYTSDPAHRLICLTAYSPDASFYYGTQVFIISTRIFFDLDGMVSAIPIPWEHWGPSNVRIFTHRDPYRSRVHISGNRVLQALPVGTGDSEFILHLTDFSPLAVTNSRGLGQVVKEPSTIEIFASNSGRRRSLTTSMPYVQVVISKRNFKSTELENIWIDKDRIYMLFVVLNPSIEPTSTREPIGRFEVIDV